MSNIENKIEASHQDRCELYKRNCDVVMFEQAEKALKYIKENSITREHPLFFQLWTAFYTIYSKPFSNRKHPRQQVEDKVPTQRERLIAEYIPDDLQSVHHEIYGRRDQMYAHTDRTAKEVEKVMNVAVLQFPQSPIVKRGFQIMTPNSEGDFSKYLELLESVYDNANQLFSEVYQKIFEGKDLKVKPTASYIINTDEPDNRVFLEYENPPICIVDDKD